MNNSRIKLIVSNVELFLCFKKDVALGCQYLEENHFIHRDIAARNCLLTNKMKAMSGNFNHINNFFNITNYSNGFNSSGIIVKIADFGE
jgi:serine/threonine protein kinase